MAVRIVTDSTCDLPADVVRELGITVVPLTVLFGEEALIDGLDIDVPSFYDRMRSYPGLPRTSQPPVERFLDAYAAAGADGSEMVSIHISSKMSGTLNAAAVAREQLSDMHIDIIDSYSVSLGLGAVVVDAARAAMQGASRAEVADVARRSVTQVHVVAVVDTLEYLRRGGRIGRATSFLGSLLSIKPILHIDGGEMAPFERVRTKARALERLHEIATKDATIRRLVVAAAGDDAAAKALFEKIQPALPHTEMVLGQIGPVVGVHAGPGLVGICTVARG
jgi:DegV family protein with EDD domain